MTCDQLRQQIAAAAPSAETFTHLAGCAACRAVAAALTELDPALAALPRRDAADALVAATLAAVRATPSATVSPASTASASTASAPTAPAPTRRLARLLAFRPPWRRPSFAFSALAAALLLVAVAVRETSWLRPRPRLNAAGESSGVTAGGGQRGNHRQEVKTREQLAAAPPAASLEGAAVGGDAGFAEPAKEEAEKQDTYADAASGLEPAGAHDDDEMFAAAPPPSHATAAAMATPTLPPAEPEVLDRIDAPADLGQVASRSETERDLLSDLEAGKRKAALVTVGNESNLQLADEKKNLAEQLAKDQRRAGDKLAAANAPVQPAQELARNWRERATAVTGIAFQEAKGYWLNTYLPGDPRMRAIDAQLRAHDPEALTLALSARPYRQPFDAPDGAAVALFVNADTTAVAGPTRVLVQVGLKGALRRAGTRPPTALGVVLDLTTLPGQTESVAVRAALTRLAALARPGDRFFVVAAGRPGALVVAPEDFKNGPLSVALTRLWTGADAATAAAAGAGATLDLAGAMRLALETAGASLAADAPPGDAGVLLVTHRQLGGDLRPLARLAHTAAVNGIHTSVLGLGDGVAGDEIDTLVRSGQGYRRLARSAAEADAAAERELAAAGEVVARALRLNLRLAPGVKLVSVLGSHRLGTVETKRVRAAEQALDRRLAASLGLAADRGQDDDGIQIVLPVYQAGDEHVVVLDVLVDRPGPLLEVSARMKDLVSLRNETVRRSLALGSGRAAFGPLERGVRKSWIAHQVAGALDEAARLVGSGDPATAATRLAAAAEMVTAVRATVPGLAADSEVAADIDLLAAASRTAASGPGRPLLSPALRYAAYRKHQTLPVEGESR